MESKQGLNVEVNQLQSISAKLKSVLAGLKNGNEIPQSEIQEMEPLLETLPLATADFSLATQRLRNAVYYLLGNQIGAAAYELRLLQGVLRRTW